MPVNISLHSLYIVCVSAVLVFIFPSFSNPAIKCSILYLILLLPIESFEILIKQDRSPMFCSLICCMCLLSFIVLYFTLRMHSISMAGISSNARPPPGTTKNLHNLSLFLCLVLHCIHLTVLPLFFLSVHKTTLLSLCYANCSIVSLQNNILNISKGIRLPSLPVSFFIFDFCPFGLLLILVFYYSTSYVIETQRCYIIYQFYMSDYNSLYFCKLS